MVVVLGGLVRLLDERMAVVGALDELPIHMGDDDLAGAFLGGSAVAFDRDSAQRVDAVAFKMCVNFGCLFLYLRRLAPTG